MALSEIESLAAREVGLIFQAVRSFLKKSSISHKYKDALWKTFISLSPSPGKLSRGNFTLLLPRLSYQACGGEGEFVSKISAAWYLFYLAADMMDSIQDQENRDEGSIISVAEGLNLASGFFFIANALLTEVLKTKNDFPALYDVIGAFHTRLLEMCDGQQQDLCAKELSLEGYLDMLRKKSGAFFSLACYIGARMACGRPDWWKRFSDFGSHLGVVIQILDDLEDWYKLQELQNNAQSVLPKMDWYKNLPAVYALEVLPSKERRDFRRAIDKVGKETSAVSDYIGWVNRSGAALFILALIGREVGYAKEALSEEALVAQPKEDLIRILELLVGKLGACSNDPTQRAQ